MDARNSRDPDSGFEAASPVARLPAARYLRGPHWPRLSLPLIDRRLRPAAVIGGGLLLIALFMLPARVHWGAPTTTLDSSRIDDWIPYLEWTIWIYISYYLYLILAIWLPRDDRLRSDAAYGLVLAGLIGLLIFTIFPTSVPRQSPDFAGITGQLWRLLFAVDTTVNA